MGLMDGKKGIVFGIANERSYAWYIAKALAAQGAEIGFTYLPLGKMERRVSKAVEAIGITDPWLVPCDAGSDADLDATFDKWEADHGRLDFIVHSIAFANKDYLEIGKFIETPREVWTQALDVSAYTLLGMAQRGRRLMTDGGSIISMSYYGGEKVTPGYNVMGVAKAALEHTTRYLAADLGVSNIRVNSISAGPFKTLAASGVGGIDKMIEIQERKAPLQRCNSGDEVGNAATFLLSDLSSGVTGEILYVDAGFNIIGI